MQVISGTYLDWDWIYFCDNCWTALPPPYVECYDIGCPTNWCKDAENPEHSSPEASLCGEVGHSMSWAGLKKGSPHDHGLEASALHVATTKGALIVSIQKLGSPLQNITRGAEKKGYCNKHIFNYNWCTSYYSVFSTIPYSILTLLYNFWTLQLWVFFVSQWIYFNLIKDASWILICAFRVIIVADGINIW